MQPAGGANGQQKIISTFVVVGCLLVVSVAVAYIVGLRALELNRDLARESEVIRELERFVSAMKDTETGQRGYLVTGEERYLEPYKDGETNVIRAAEELQQLGASGDLPANEVQRLRDLAVKKLAELKETIKLWHERGPQAAVELVRSGRGLELMNEIRAVVGEMQARKQAEFVKANARAKEANVGRTTAFITTMVVNLVFLGWAYGRLSRLMGQREREKELLATTLASIGDGVVVTDAQGRVRLLNAEAERITGWSSSEARGKELSEIFKIENERTG